MELQVFPRIPVFGSDRTGIARETARGHAALPARFCTEVTATVAERKLRWIDIDSADRTVGNTGLCFANVASVSPEGDTATRGPRKTDCTAIPMPEAVLRMNKDTERRRLQPFGSHCPLLERLPRWIGWEIGGAPEYVRQRANDLFRPCVERIGTVITLTPLREGGPDRTACIAEQQDGYRVHAICEKWPLARIEIYRAAKQDTARFEQCFDLAVDGRRAAHVFFLSEAPCTRSVVARRFPG
jgi:hypothetical protein